MSLRRIATAAAMWGLIQKWGYHTIRLAVFVVLARLLTPESFGLVALAGVFVLFGEMLVDQGFSDAIVQRSKLGPAHRDCAFWASLATGIGLTAICLLTAGSIATAFDQPELAPILRWLSLALLIASLSRTQEALLRRDMAFKRIAVISLVSMASGGVVGLALALAGFGVWSLVWQQLVQRLVQLPLLWWATGWHPRARFSRRHFRSLFPFGINVVGINLLNFINRQADDLLIGYFLGPTALGYYTVGYRLIRMLLDLVPYALMPVAFSTFSRMQGDAARMREGLYEATRILALAMFPVFCGIAVLAPELVSTLFGDRWLPSALVMQVLAPIGLLQSSSLLFSTALKAAGRPGRVLALSSMNALANLIGFAVAVHWGIVAVAAAYTIRGYLFWPVTWWVLDRLLSLSPLRYAQALAPAVSGAAVMVGLLLLIQIWMPAVAGIHSILVVSAIVGVAGYGAIVCAAAPEQRRALWRLLAQRIPAHGARS